MDPVTTVLFAGAATFAVLWTVYVWAKSHAQDLASASKMLDEHYTATQRLIGDPEVPMAVVEFATRYAEAVGNPSLAREFAFGLFRNALGIKRTAGKRTPKSYELEAALNQLSERQMAQFAEMFVNGMGSSAASDPILSRVYLHSLHMFFSRSGAVNDQSYSTERANTAAVNVSAGLCAA